MFSDNSAAMKNVSANARERETFRYDPSLIARSVINESHALLDSSKISTSADTSLTAFAQLGTLRLRAQRGLISLFDRHYQHIVAEATSSSGLGPLQPNDGDDQDRHLWMCGTAIPRSDSVCEHVLAPDDPTPHKSPNAEPKSEPESPNLPVSVVPDLAADSRFESKPYYGISDVTPARFYAGVPLQSRRGINIGVFCVLDPEPRDESDVETTRVLQDLSRSIMTYLETSVTGKSYQRNVRMVRGLGTLVEGKGSMSRWWLNDNSESFESGAGAEGALNVKQQDIQRSDEQEAISPAVEVPPPSIRTDSFSGVMPTLPDASSFETSVPSTDTASREALKSHAGIGSVTGTFSGLDFTATSVYQHEDEDATEMTALFSRAANIIRESIEVEGCMFVDAAISSFGGLVAAAGAEAQSESMTDSPSSDDSLAGRTEGSTVNCKVLGFSTSKLSSVDGEVMPYLTMPESFLKSLLRRFPAGRVFNFDETGTLQSASSEEQDSGDRPMGDHPLRRRKGRQPRPSDRDVLMSIFTGARSIAIVPMWDSHTEKWFAAGFIWTRTPLRVFNSGDELSYLKAFGMTIMAEAHRIIMLRVDKAKADVLGSLSHELRSPLHGIMVGVELLHDTAISGFQEDVMNTLETCGRTLVDTIDHLLDYSKINHFIKSSKKRSNSRQGRGLATRGDNRIDAGMMSLFADASLDILTEEVIESIYAGFSFQHMPDIRPGQTDLSRASTTRRFDSTRSLESFNDQGAFSRSAKSVSVYVNIDPAFQWTFHTQPGAIRRVIMNLFGNALKYTSRGSIIVSLKQERISEKTKNRRRNVVFSISDTGKGISAEYLRTQLFSPFAQEDHLTPGAGLGLSLVKQIVNSLGGRISVDSQVRRGTTVHVTLPMTLSRSASTRTVTPAEDDFTARVEELRGLEFGLVGFDADEDMNGPHLAHLGRLPTPKSLMHDICQSWLKMRHTTNYKARENPPAFYLCTEDSMNQIPPSEASGPLSPVVVVVCRSALAAHELATSYTPETQLRTYEFISQPCGPRKLGKILSAGRKHQIQSQQSHPAAGDISEFPADKKELPIRKPPEPSLDSTALCPASSAQSSAPTNGEGGELNPLPSSAEMSKHLLVDDNAINLKVLASYMKKFKHQYSTAENGLEALEAYRRAPEDFACIFMDISMPVMDGLESTRLIRAFEAANKLQPVLIVALTGLASTKTQSEAFASGVDLFLTKPVKLKELESIIQGDHE